MRPNMCAKFISVVALISGIVFLPPPAGALDYSQFIESDLIQTDKTISMDFENAALSDVLKIFSQQSGLNFVAATSVANQSIHVYFDNVPIEAALERILAANNLTYEIHADTNIFTVKRVPEDEIQTMTRVYSLKHATIPASQINSTLTAGEDGEGSGEDGGAAGGILEAVQTVLSPTGTIVEDPRTNSIIVTDIPSRFPLVEQTLARLDVRVPLILIEAEMLDVSKNDVDKLGVKWGEQPFVWTGASKGSLAPFREEELIEENTSASDKFGDVAALSLTEGTIDFTGLTATLNFLRTRTDTKSLSRPRLLTLNNQTAEIEVVTDEAIGQLLSQSGDGDNQINTQEPERAETGVSLRVTPQANVETGEIIMAIEPQVAASRASRFGGQAFRDVEERATRSILRVNDGQTIVIAGLLRTDENNTNTRMPIMSKIPILGAAFRHKDLDKTDRELIVFITPNIVKEADQKRLHPTQYGKLVREQDMPSGKNRAVSRELSYFENQRF